MNRIIQKIAASLVVMSVVFSSACSYDEDAETRKLKKTTEDFIQALAADDEDSIDDLTDGYKYNRDDEYSERYQYGDLYEIIKYAISQTEIKEWGEVEYDKAHETAWIDVTLSYIDLFDFAQFVESEYTTMSVDEYTAALDEFPKDEGSWSLKLIKDESEETWRLSEFSAQEIANLFKCGFNGLPMPVLVSATVAEAEFISFLENIAAGDFSEYDENYLIEDCRVFENVYTKGSDPASIDAVHQFVSAYVGYILEHDYEITVTYNECAPNYSFTLNGSAPSGDELFLALTTDEFTTQYIGLELSCELNVIDIDTLLSDRAILVNTTLADTVPNCSPEDYSLTCYYTIDDEYLRVSSDLVNMPRYGQYEAEQGVNQDQYMRCAEAAFDQLYADGEISQAQYDYSIENLTPETYGFTPDDTVNSAGRPNQAIGTWEYIPEWCTDGSMCYGSSHADSNNFWMFYSVDPAHTDTVGYYMDEEGVWITCYFNEPFGRGATLAADWWIDGEQVVDNEYILIEHDDQYEVEVFLPWDAIPESGCYEMRLWREDHSYVLDYVSLTCTPRIT